LRRAAQNPQAVPRLAKASQACPSHSPREGGWLGGEIRLNTR
jgi:hypothetical protein